ncbi:MAG: geranylgeranylglyceryl/heptaprenylglyceryl phosphate synthase [Bacteroidetes bacterium]|nr:geranylgeranylglyceryl/heptaprenylglyceryl phosphate synthase [Bacteroidota bacterium]
MWYPFLKNTAAKKLAVLIDPDKLQGDALVSLVQQANTAKVDFLLVGGSLLLENILEKTIATIKAHTALPVILFPGNNYQLSTQADALLMLSLLSGRNAEYLIGQQVVAAPAIRAAKLETISTGYLLVDGGRVSTTSYITQTMPIPHHKPDVAVATAMAGEMLGMQIIYLEAGSGAQWPVPEAMIRAVRKNISVPLIVGGGIRSSEAAEAVCRAGADIVVVGNVLEQEPERLLEISLAVHANYEAVV